MRTKAQLDAASRAVESWLDTLDVEALADTTDQAQLMRNIGEANRLAVESVAESETRLLLAIQEGRRGGLTLTQIAVMLGVTRQAVSDRFGSALSSV